MRMKKTNTKDWKSIRTKVAYAVELLEEVDGKLNSPKNIERFTDNTIDRVKKLKRKLYSRSAREYPEEFGDGEQTSIDDF